MARYNDGTRYNSGARYVGEASKPKRPMSKIKINVIQLPVPQKLGKGQEFITKGTANPNVPGNAALITALTTAQTALQMKEAAATAARTTSMQCTADRDAAETDWMSAVNNLGSFTQSATDGDAGKILSAGFDIRASDTPTALPDAVENVMVNLNGAPGHSKLKWKAVPVADGYLVQGSPDPITATSWAQPGVATKTTFEANGAIAGQKYWYRVAAFNTAGQGPWSALAERPLM